MIDSSLVRDSILRSGLGRAASREAGALAIPGGDVATDPFPTRIINRTIGLDPERNVTTGTVTPDAGITLEFSALSKITRPIALIDRTAGVIGIIRGTNKDRNIRRPYLRL